MVRNLVVKLQELWVTFFFLSFVFRRKNLVGFLRDLRLISAGGISADGRSPGCWSTMAEGAEPSLGLSQEEGHPDGFISAHHGAVGEGGARPGGRQVDIPVEPDTPR